MSSASTSCGICTEVYTKRVRSAIMCPYCAKDACRKCVETYLVENTLQPKCMFCNTGWNKDFLRKNMTKTYMSTTYREHVEKSLEAEARAEFPALQRMARLQERDEKLVEEIRQLQMEISVLKYRLEEKQRERYTIRRGQEYTTDRQTTSARVSIMFPCSRPECNGTLDAESNTCLMCDVKYCGKCMTMEGEEHECREDDINNFRILRENTRPCPNCRNGIYKTEGCDQMWCTVCQTCFSWRTGNILNGVIHNPHYYEFMRNNPQAGAPRRNVGDIPCGGMPTLHQVMTRELRDKPGDGDTVSHLHRMMNHIIDVVMPRVHGISQRRRTKNREYGIQFLRNMITREKWISRLFIARKREEVYQQKYQLLETLTFSVSELFRQLARETIGVKEFFHSIQVLFGCYNEGTRYLNKSFNTNYTLLSLTTLPFTIR